MTARIRIQHLDDGPNQIEITARYRGSGAEPGPIASVSVLRPGEVTTTWLHTGLDITLREIVPPRPRHLVSPEEDGA